MPSEEEKRDLERAEEYEITQSRTSLIGKNKFELSTGLIIAARYADKLRRVAFVAFGKMVPKEIILRDVGELNKQLYDIIVNQMKLDKLDVVRILVDAEYDEQNQKINFTNVRIIRYYTEDKVNKMIEEYKEKCDDLQHQLEDLKHQLEEYKQKIKAVEDLIKSIS